MKLKDLEAGTKFKFKGYEFIKLADEEESCYCLLNDTVFDSEFGETNDWAKSVIRERLNELDPELNTLMCMPEIHKDDLVEVSLNYYSYKTPNGRTSDRVTLLSWEEWKTYYYVCDFDIPVISSWLRSGGLNSAYFANSVTSDGSDFHYYVLDFRAVRPALHLKKDIEVE